MPQLFGTDGVRGIANSPQLSPQLAFALGQAAVRLCQAHRPRAVIGRDTRRSGPLLEAALTAGILAAGGDVIRLGVATTPAVAYLTRRLQADLGVVISASHNPAEYNGIKFFGPTGHKLPDAAEEQIEAMVLDRGGPCPTGAGIGELVDDPGAVDAYVAFLAGTVDVSLQGLKVVVDCGHGAACQLSPAVLRRLGAEVVVLNDQPDGLNINAGCGSTQPEGLQRAVVACGAHAGIAHDGDADRCIAVDERGGLVDGDQILAACALDLQARGRLAGDLVVATVMSNLGLELLLGRHGIRLERTRVGDRYVLAEMLRRGASLGGEQSGHIIFLDHSTTGDGILTAVQLLAVMARQGRPLSELAGRMQRLPQVLENVPVREHRGWQDNPRITGAIRQAEAVLGAAGRVLVRPSGTEPLIRVMLEGPSLEQLQQLAGVLRGVVADELGEIHSPTLQSTAGAVGEQGAGPGAEARQGPN